jgi:hypothetical protein
MQPAGVLSSGWSFTAMRQQGDTAILAWTDDETLLVEIRGEVVGSYTSPAGWLARGVFELYLGDKVSPSRRVMIRRK